MKILLVSASHSELAPLLSVLKLDINSSNIIQNSSLDILITGVGMINTTYHLAKKLNAKKYDLVINLGIAGSFDTELNIGETLRIHNDLFAELGAEDGDEFLSLIQLGLMEPDEFPYKWGELAPEFPSINCKTLNELKVVRAITVNKVHGNTNSIVQIKKRLNPQIESMEGAAFFYTCMHEAVNCIQIRCISNYVERRNRDKWNIPLAIEKLNATVVQIIRELSD